MRTAGRTKRACGSLFCFSAVFCDMIQIIKQKRLTGLETEEFVSTEKGQINRSRLREQERNYVGSENG